MIGLFRVHYFDPVLKNRNMEAFTVAAINAEQAIVQANKKKSCKKYRVEHVDCLGLSDE